MSGRAITDHELSRRKLVANLKARLTETLGMFVADNENGITYVEAVMALHDVAGRMLGELIADEWKARATPSLPPANC